MRAGIWVALPIVACSQTPATDGGVMDATGFEDQIDDASADQSIFEAADDRDASSDTSVDTNTCEHTPVMENCFNDADDDCDALVDCADPDCTPTAECVPSAPGQFDLGTMVPQNNACPQGYGSKTDLYNQVDPGTDCVGCSCSPSLTCSVSVGDFGSNACPNGPLQTSFDLGKFCQDNAGQGFGFSSGKLSMGAPITTANCNGAGNPSTPPLKWGSEVTFCTTQMTGGCGLNQRCVPKLANGKHCAVTFGSMACPSGYAAQGVGVWYTSFVDKRTCDPCTCSSQPQGADCSMVKVVLYPQIGCLGNPKTEAPNSTDCAAGGPYQSGTLGNPPPMPTCNNSGAASKVSGSVQLGSDRTVCCQ